MYQEFKAKQRNFFDSLRAAGTQTRTSPPADIYIQEFQKLLLDFLRLMPEKDVVLLDVGCGDGIWGEYCVTHSNVSLVGIDISPNSILAARARFTGDPVCLCIGDVERIPLADDSVDAVICTSVLHHMPQITLALDEMKRTLRPGGKVFILEHISTNPIIELGRKVFRHMPRYVKTALRLQGDLVTQDHETVAVLPIKADELECALKERGFRIIDGGYAALFLFMPALIISIVPPAAALFPKPVLGFIARLERNALRCKWLQQYAGRVHFTAELS